MPLENNALYKEYLESLLNTEGDTAIFFSSTGIITDISPLMESYYGWKLADVTGKSVESLYQLNHLSKPFSLAEYNNLRNDNATIDTFVRIDSDKIHVSWSCIKLSASSGFMLVGRNISKIKELNIQQRTLNSQLEKISGCIPGNFYWKNTKAQYLGCNDTLLKTLCFHSMVDIIGKTDHDLWPDQAEELKKNDQQVIQTGETLFLEEKVTMLGKEDRYFTVIKMPLLDEEGNIIGILGNSLDITELKNTQEQLRIAIEKAEVANNVKTEFIANISHDIRTPLTGIIGFSHYLEEHIKDLEEKAYAKQIHDSGEQLLRLLNGVLDMITADSTNENNVRKEPFDLHDLVQDVLELELPAVHANHLAIERNMDEVVPHYVIGDKMKLHRILLNLAGNAIKFTKVGHIELNAKLLAQEEDIATIEFQVKDTGIGIPEESQKKVFDRFFKISPSSKGLYNGNGIGLHIAQKYVELLGGQLRLESQEGVGTSFFFILKMKLVPEDVIVQEKIKTSLVVTHSVALPAAIATHKPDQLRVLLVEDNSAALKVLEMMMKPYSADIHTAKDAESAFLLVQQQAFDLIITDIGLPKKNGDELAKDIRSWETKQHRAASVIVGLTGHAQGEITEGCLDAGMNEVYRKPITAEPLKNLMQRFKTNSQDISAKPETALNFGMPKTENELFEVNKLPLFDETLALQLLGSENMILEIFETFIEQGIKPDLNLMQNAHTNQDWETIEKLAHKMKAGAVYGTIRLHHALLYLERYLKAGGSDCLESLYSQLLRVIDETNTYLNFWLNKEKTRHPELRSSN